MSGRSAMSGRSTPAEGARSAAARDLRLLVPAGVAWAAAWGAVAAPDLKVPGWLPAVVAWGVAGGLLGALVLVRRRLGVVARSATAAALLAATAAALVTQSVAVTADVRETSPLRAAAESVREVDVVVELKGAPRPVTASPASAWADGDEVARVRFRADVVALDGQPVPRVAVRVVGPAEPGLVFGARAAFPARVDVGPAADAAAFRLRPTGAVTTSSPGGFLAWTAGLRAEFAAEAERLGGDGGALVPGLAIGDTGAVGEQLDADMKVSSLTHLTAVSGANCAIVTALVFALAAACGAPRVVRVLVALVALAGFVALVTPEASVIRAATMAVVVLVATAFGRPGGGVAALSLAVIVLLTVDPWISRDYGFALSVCATSGLLLLAGPLGRQLTRVMPRPLAMVLAVPMAAQAACQPVLVLLDPAIATYGVVANLLAGPAAPVATMVGLAGCLLLPLLPSVGFAAMQVAAMPATWIALVAHGVAAMPVARLPWIADVGGALVLAAATGAGLWLLFARRRPRWLHRAVAVVVLLAVAVPMGVSIGGPLLRRAGLPGDWVVAACDIGQGDAVLVRDRGAVALIDTGPDDHALERCLALTGVDRIDLLVLTHWDADHVAAVGAVAGRVAIVIHGPLDGERSTRALEPLVAGGAETHEVTAGMRGRLGGAEWEVLWPPPDHEPGNDASVVLDVRGSDARGVFLGDLGEAAQAQLLRDARPGPVDLVKVAHHGSADQSAALYAALRAKVGLIGVGVDNGYGHPTGSLLQLLADQGTAVVRTDHVGTAVLALEDGRFRLWSERTPGPSEASRAAAMFRPPRAPSIEVRRGRGPLPRIPSPFRRTRRTRVRARSIRSSPLPCAARDP